MSETTIDKHNFLEIYSEDNYFSKKDLKVKFKEEFTEEMWTNIINYRYSFKNHISFINSKKHKFYITLSPKMIQKEVMLHKIFSKLEIKSYLYNINWEKYKIKSLTYIKNNFILLETIIICKAYNFEIEKNILIDIIDHKYKAPDFGHEFASIIYHFFYSLKSRPTLDSEYLINWYKKITNYKYQNNIFKNITTISDSKTSQDNLESENNLKNLEENLNKLNNFFLNDNDLNIFVKAISVYYFIKYYRFFKKYNELMAIICFYTVLSKYYPIISPQLGIINLITKNYSEFEKYYTKSVNSDDDVTYFARYLLEKIIYAVDKLSEEYKDLLEYNLDKEERDNSISINVKSKLLLSKKPKLSIKQARFFISHCSPNSHYTVNDFKKYCNTSYETSRYSLNNLVKENLYEKSKIGKRFVYKIKS